MKDANANFFINTRVQITKSEQLIAKRLAKQKGYTFQGWLGQLVRNEINKTSVQESNSSLNL